MEHRPLIDELTTAMIEKKETYKSMSVAEPTTEEMQDLLYRPGDKLIDSTTGKEVIVLAGKRAIGTVPGTKES